MRLVAQVHADDGGVVQVALRQRTQSLIHALSGYCVVYHRPLAFGAVARLGAMVVENDVQPDLPGIGDDLVQDLQRVQPLQVGVNRAAAVVIADVRGNDGRLHHLVRHRHANHVVAVALDGIQDVVIILRPQSVYHFVGGLEAIPVDAGDANDVAVGIQNLVSAGVPISGLREGGARHQSHDHQPNCPSSAERAAGAKCIAA